MLPVILTLLATLNPSGPRVDAYGDPLPPGVVARLGSVRWLCPEAPEHLMWSPDGKYLVGTHGGKSLTIWGYPAGTVAGRFEIPDPPRAGKKAAEPSPFPPTLSPQQVRFSPDGRSMLVYGGENQLFRVRLPDGRAEQINTGGHRGAAVAVSADGGRVLMEVPDAGESEERWSRLCVLDLHHAGPLRTVWNRRVVRRIERGMLGHDYCRALPAQMGPDGRFVVAASADIYDQTYAVFDLATGRSWMPPGVAIDPGSMAPDGQTFLVSDPQGPLTRWGFVKHGVGIRGPLARPIARVPGSRSGPWHFNPDGRTAVAVGWRDTNRDGHAERSVTVLDVASLRAVREWDYRPGDEVLIRHGSTAVHTGPHLDGSTATCAVAPDKRMLAIASSDSPRVRFFDLTTGSELRPVGGHAAAVTTMRCVGARLVSVGADQAARVWEVPAAGGRDRAGPARGLEVEAFDRFDENDLPPRRRSEARVKVFYDRDRNRVEARDPETEVIVWERGAPGLAAVPQTSRPRSLPTVLDAEWDRVAVATGESVAVCDLKTGEAVAEVHAPGCWATAIEFARDPDTLYVGYHDGQVLVWDLRPTDLPRRAPSDAEFRVLWSDLGGSPREAGRTRSAFLDDPPATLRWLDAHLRPLARPTELDIDLWLARLSHPKFVEREEATRQLVRHFDVAGPAVAELLAVTKSPEVEHRLRMVIDRQAGLGGDGEVVRLVRAVTILERIGSADATKLLFRIARGGGVPAERATDALVRMKDGEKSRPANQPQRTIVQGGVAEAKPGGERGP